MPIEIEPLIREVYRQAALKEIAPPAVTRLVKLLYLADIEWRKRHDGEPLLNVTWRFLHYGPYAAEFSSILGGPDLETHEVRNGRFSRRFDFADDQIASSQVPEEARALLSTLVKKWGDSDLNTLLDHVYFETEPMENAKRGDLLDFSRLRPAARVKRTELDPRRLSEIRAKIRERTAALHLTRDGLHIPPFDVESDRAWDDDHATVQLPLGQSVKFTF